MAKVFNKSSEVTSQTVRFRHADFDIIETDDGFEVSWPAEQIDFDPIIDAMRAQGFNLDEAYRAVEHASGWRTMRMIGKKLGMLS